MRRNNNTEPQQYRCLFCQADYLTDYGRTLCEFDHIRAGEHPRDYREQPRQIRTDGGSIDETGGRQ